MPAVSMHKKLPPAQWRDEITLWLESLTAAGLSQDTVNTRRCKIGHAARCLDKSPYDVTSEDLVHWTASQSWKAETRKGYRNTLVGFFRWLHATGRRADDPAAALPKVRKTRPHPRPCPDVHIYAAMCAANDVERHRGETRVTLSFSRVSDLPDDMPDWIKSESSVKRHAAAVREAAVLLEAEGVAITYTYMPEETK